MSDVKEALLPLPCVCASTRRAARAVTLLYDDALRGTGLRVTQFSLLYPLAGYGEMTQSHLGGLLVLDKTTLTRSLKPLERAGWIRSRPGADRRERLWRLTPTGAGVLKRAVKQWERAQKRVLRRVSRDWVQLQAALDDLATAALPAAKA